MAFPGAAGGRCVNDDIFSDGVIAPWDDPGDLGGTRAVGQTDESIELMDTATQQLRNLVALVPLSAQYRADLFEVSLLQGQFLSGDPIAIAGNLRNALDEFQVALELNPNDPTMHHRASSVYGQLGDALRDQDSGEAGAAYLSGARLARHSRQIVHNVVNKDRDHALMVELFKKAAEAFDAADDASAVDVRKELELAVATDVPK